VIFNFLSNFLKKANENKLPGWVHSSVTENLLCLHEALGSIPSTTKRKTNNKVSIIYQIDSDFQMLIIINDEVIW
jgi:hypothetical protein